MITPNTKIFVPDPRNITKAPGMPWVEPFNPGVSPTPSFMPGMGIDQKIEFVRSLIKDSVKARGFRHTIAASSNDPRRIQLSGVAKMLLGFSVFYEEPALTDIPSSVILRINEENVISDVSPHFFSNEFTDSEYYWFPRPLSGSDNISWTPVGQAANVEHLVFYYL